MDDDLDPFPAFCVGGGGCCPCSCCSATSWRRSVKRRVEPEDGGAVVAAEVGGVVAARVEIVNEVAVLREMVAGKQKAINELIEELEEERSASASATSEAMSMILRLQREKADVQMDARNFKRFAEEQMVHDQEELAGLEEVLMRREEALQSVALEVEACRHRLLSLGIDPDAGAFNVTDVEGNVEVIVPMAPQFDGVSDYEYPPLKCGGEYTHNEEEVVEDMHLQEELDELEMMGDVNGVLEKDVVEHLVTESFENGPELKNTEKFPVTEGGPLDDDSGDEMSDRVYTVVAEHAVPTDSVLERYTEEKIVEFGRERGSVDIKKLYERLQALEEDRETMRNAIITMRTEKAQLALLKEMAQHLRKDVTPEKALVKKKSWIETFSLLASVKWLVSFVLWRKKVSRSKYMFGLSNANVGLLLLLDKSPQFSNWRC